jgi:hypothetical protein
MVDLSKMAYPDKVIIEGKEYEARRDTSSGKVSVPYTEEPDVGIGDVITQKAGKRKIQLKVIDVSFQEGGSLGVGTKHPNILNLNVRNVSAEEHSPKPHSSTINIGSISGEMVQVGDENVQIVDVSVKQLVEYVANSGDQEAKSRLKALLANGTVASLIGSGASKLLNLL